MPKYIFAYHGGKPPATPEEGQKVIAAWMAWFQGMGDAVQDGGAPCGPSRTVSSSGTAMDGGANPLSGYSLVTADSHDAACAMARGCPILKDGGSVEVCEALPM